MIRYGPFTLDVAARRLTRLGETVHLTPKAFDLLQLLIDAAPGVVSKDSLHAALWPNHAVTDATLVGLVKELRRAHADDDAEYRIVRTVHRVGYAFDAAFTQAQGAAPSGGLLFIGARRVNLTEADNLIGRNAGCAVYIDHATVSRRHARILVDADRITLEDLGSKNGTRLHGELIAERRELSDGDLIQFGDVDVVFRRAISSQPTATRGSTS